MEIHPSSVVYPHQLTKFTILLLKTVTKRQKSQTPGGTTGKVKGSHKSQWDLSSRRHERCFKFQANVEIFQAGCDVMNDFSTLPSLEPCRCGWESGWEISTCHWSNAGKLMKWQINPQATVAGSNLDRRFRMSGLKLKDLLSSLGQ